MHILIDCEYVFKKRHQNLPPGCACFAVVLESSDELVLCENLHLSRTLLRFFLLLGFKCLLIVNFDANIEYKFFLLKIY